MWPPSFEARAVRRSLLRMTCHLWPLNHSPAKTRIRLRRLRRPGIEMLEARQHLLLQQPQRIVPGLRLVLVVEAEHQQRAETTDLVVDLLDLLGDGGGRT